MSEITPQLAEKLVAACQANAQELAEVLGRALDQQLQVTCGETASISDELRAEWQQPGLVVLLKAGDKGLAAILPESTGLLPGWYSSPDATGESKLSTLAQEVGMLVVPDDVEVEDFQASSVENLADAVNAASPDGEANQLSIELKTADSSGHLQLIWPLNNPDAMFASSSPADTEAATGEGAENAPPTPEQSTASAAKGSQPEPEAYRFDSSQLPSYTRSLLKVKVPVRVVLASKKETVTEIVEMAAGTIVKFDKACDQPLHLYVGDQCVGEGEAVKVGDKFGFRLTTLLLPGEHFVKLGPKRAG